MTALTRICSGQFPRVKGTCCYESRCLVIHVRVSIDGRDPLGAIIVMRKDCPRSSRNAYRRLRDVVELVSLRCPIRGP